jgi:hypothetical protein
MRRQYVSDLKEEEQGSVIVADGVGWGRVTSRAGCAS